ncbi:hypothetical protein ACA910_014214 [Epithemia clementina (nom. ined.)]
MRHSSLVGVILTSSLAVAASAPFRLDSHHHILSSLSTTSRLATRTRKFQDANNQQYSSGNALINLRGGANDKDDEDSTAVAATKTALSVAVGLAAISIIIKQPAVQELLSNFGLATSTTTNNEGQTIVAITKKPTVNPPPPPPPRVESLKSVIASDSVNDTTVIVKTVISVAMTTLGLMGLLYAAQTETVTEFYASLGLPKEIWGVSPVLYITFWFLTFAASAVTDLFSAGVSAAFQQALRPNEVPSAEWYASIPKPSWNPPGWVFAVMWLIVSKPTQFSALRQIFLPSAVAFPTFPTPAVSDTAEKVASVAASAITAGGANPNWLVLGVYCLHLALGNAWNDVFFGFQKIGLGLGVIVIFWATLLLSTLLFYKDTPWAGYLMLPTCAWVTVATCLNWSIYNLSKKQEVSNTKKRWH